MRATLNPELFDFLRDHQVFTREKIVIILHTILFVRDYAFSETAP